MLDFYRGKRVFVTGHTGFKGSWLCLALLLAGAEVTGYALPPEDPGLFQILGLAGQMRSIQGDVRDLDGLWRAFRASEPELVMHLAAQPIVRAGYRDPAGTYSVNVMGTVHLLECVRRGGGVRSVVNVTTDKVYAHQGSGCREGDPLGALDPYGCSKSCSELVTASYRAGFFAGGPAVSTARAGNVIGGGDFAPDRVLPDCIRAVRAGEPIALRNPGSVRPYQHVLEALSAYLLIGRRQYEDPGLAGSYNVGPAPEDCLTTGALAGLFCRAWGEGARWEASGEPGPREEPALRLDCGKLRARLGWSPRWDAERAVQETVAWTKAWLAGADMRAFTRGQMEAYWSAPDPEGPERRTRP